MIKPEQPENFTDRFLSHSINYFNGIRYSEEIPLGEFASSFLGNKTYPGITRCPAKTLWSGTSVNWPGRSFLCYIRQMPDKLSDFFAWGEVRDQ
jgi:hypothetical protein